MSQLKVRLYKYNPTSGNKRVAVSGYQTYFVPQGAAAADVASAINAMITVFAPDRQNQEVAYSGFTSDTAKVGQHWIDVSKVNTATAGVYTAYIKYRNDSGNDTTVGEVTVIVGEVSWSIQKEMKGYTIKNASLDSKVKVITDNGSSDATFQFGGAPVAITIGMLTKDGTFVDTSVTGTYSGLTLTYKGIEICTDFTLIVEASDPMLDYPTFPEPGSVKVDKGGKELTTSDTTGVAQIELSATAKPDTKGLDLIVIVDLSSSMRYAVDGSKEISGPFYNPIVIPDLGVGDVNTRTHDNGYLKQYHPDQWTKTRMFAMEKSLSDLVASIQKSKADVQIAISNFGDLDHMEFKDAVLEDSMRDWVFLNSANNPSLGNSSFAQFDTKYDPINQLNYILGRDNTSFNNNSKYSMPFELHEWKYEPNDGWDPYNEYPHGKISPKIYTGDGKFGDGAFVDVDSLTFYEGSSVTYIKNDTTYNRSEIGRQLEICKEMEKTNAMMIGTNYDIGLETAYHLAYGRQQANIAASTTRPTNW